MSQIYQVTRCKSCGKEIAYLVGSKAPEQCALCMIMGREMKAEA